MRIKIVMLLCVSFLCFQNLFSFEFSFSKKPQVKVIKIHNNASIEKLYAQLYEVGNNAQIDAVLLVVGHHGGTVNEWSSIADMIEAVNKRKPVVSLIVGGAYSMGYYMVAASDYIIAHSKTEVGSLGVIQTIMKQQELSKTAKPDQYSAKKVTPHILYVGKYKGLMSVYDESFTDEQKDYLQQLIQNHYDSLVKRVAEQRNLDVTKAHEWADGKTFTSEQALKLGLIDKIGTIFDVPQIVATCLSKRRLEKNSKKKYSVSFIS